MVAIKDLSGQEYVHMYASDRKAELAEAARQAKSDAAKAKSDVARLD